MCGVVREDCVSDVVSSEHHSGLRVVPTEAVECHELLNFPISAQNANEKMRPV